MEAIVGGQRIAGILIDGGSSVNVISMATCRQLGITKWSDVRPGRRGTGGGTEGSRKRTNVASVDVNPATSRGTVHIPLPAERQIKGKRRRAKARQ
jgi:hypothetical protein